MAAIEKVSGAPRLADEVYATVLRKVLAGELPLGSPLSRRSLAEELGVSTLLVGMAFERLSGEGFIESRPRAGTRVKLPTKDEVRGNYVVREALETQVARLFSEVADRDQKTTLVRMAGELDALYLSQAQAKTCSDRSARAEAAHIEFHNHLANTVDCPQLAREIERTRVLLFNWLFTRNTDWSPLPADWHTQLASVLAEGSVDDADRVMRHHVRYRMDEVIERVGTMSAELADGPRMMRGPHRKRTSPQGG